MKTIKKTKEHTIIQKHSGRYCVRTARGQWINGEDKITILSAAGLVKAPAKKAPPAEEPVAEAPAAEEAVAEAPAAEAATEEKTE